MTPRQKAFVGAYVKERNATKAAEAAGYSRKTAKQIGSRLLTNVDVARAIADRERKVAERNELSVDDHLETLAELRDAALKANQLAAAVTAETKRGEVAGFYVKRTEDVTGMTREQKRERLLRLLA